MKKYVILIILFLSMNAFAANIYSLEISYDGVLVTGKAAWQSDKPAKIFSGNFEISGANVDDGTIYLPEGRTAFTFQSEPQSSFGNWFPQPEESAYYMLKISLPKNFIAAFEGDEVSVINNIYTFRSRGEKERPRLVVVESGKTISMQQNGVNIKVAFTDKNRQFAEAYLKECANYIDMYEKLLGKFPFESFSVVEVPYPVGYSFDGFTTLGSFVIPLPFITKTSLGHEVLHQWFGSLVEVDYDKGNWAEGITTYMADYYYDELQWQGKDYRKNALIAFQSYADNSTDFPLSDFRSRYAKSDSVVGYNKAMMFFHMLRRTYGDGKFLEALRHFLENNAGKKASWDSWKQTFNETTGESSELFFDTWITEKGLPEYSLSKLAVKSENGKYKTSFFLERNNGNFAANVPVAINTLSAQEDFILFSDNESKFFELETNAEPVSIAVDPYYDVPRKLSSTEVPPVLSAYLGAAKKVVVKDDEASNCLLKLSEQGDVEHTSFEGFKLEDYKEHSVLFLNAPDNIFQRYFGRTSKKDTGISLEVFENPFSEGNVIVNISGEEDINDGLCRRLLHYGKYSELNFKNGKNTKKDIKPSKDGIIYNLKNTKYAFKVADALTLEDIANDAEGARLIFIGERHDSHAHHANQLALIQLIYKKNKNLVIGMEMFQRPFQSVLDEYISGDIDEEAMLKKTEYFSRWKFDYHLYKPILRFAKENKIRIIALNSPTGVTKKTATEGLANLSDEDRIHTSKEIDYFDSDYKNDLKFVFDMHPSRQVFTNFLEAQLLWDETMAEVVADYANNNDGVMVVLAGNGHIRKGYGIPDRVKRRTNLNYISIVQDEIAENKIADFVLYPEPLMGTKAPMLGVGIKDSDTSPEIIDVGDDSIAKKGGLEVGDIIIAFGGKEIASLEDLKIALFYTNKGEKVEVKFIRGNKEKLAELEF